VSSNYPLGVTGNEYEIAGPDTETEAQIECSTCEETTEFMVYTFGHEKWADCQTCGYRMEEEEDELP
jgi:hypothetical protein